jgi:hypothetical protein
MHIVADSQGRFIGRYSVWCMVYRVQRMVYGV